MPIGIKLTHLLLHHKPLGEENKQKHLLMTCVHKRVYNKRILKRNYSIINFISVTRGRMVDRVCNHLLLLSLYFLCPQQVLQLSVVLYLKEWAKSSPVQDLSHEWYHLIWVVFFIGLNHWAWLSGETQVRNFLDSLFASIVEQQSDLTLSSLISSPQQTLLLLLQRPEKYKVSGCRLNLHLVCSLLSLMVEVFLNLEHSSLQASRMKNVSNSSKNSSSGHQWTFLPSVFRMDLG